MLHGEAASLVEPVAFLRRKDVHLLNGGYFRILRIDLSQTVQVRAFFFGVAILLGIASQPSNPFSLVGAYQKDLFPVLRREIHGSNGLKQAGLPYQNVDT